jgi:hypothetical protein
MRQILAIVIFAWTVAASPRVLIRFDPFLGSSPRDGRLIIIFSKDMKSEPRKDVTWGLKTQQIFGKDVDGWRPGATVEMTGDTPGDPLRRLGDLRPTRIMSKPFSTSTKRFIAQMGTC